MSTKDLINSLEASHSANFGESLIYPASPLYFLKAMREKIEVFLDGSQKTKAMRQVEFAQRRLREVASLIKHNRQDLIPPTLEQYKLHLQNVGNLTSRDEDLQLSAGETVSSHLDVLEGFYGSTGEERAKQAIRAAIVGAQDFNSSLLKDLSLPKQQKLIDKIAKPQALACQFLMREASSEALNDTERVDLGQKVTKCTEDVRMNLKDKLEEILKSNKKL